MVEKEEVERRPRRGSCDDDGKRKEEEGKEEEGNLSKCMRGERVNE